MEIIPDSESNRNTVGAASQNFEALDVDVRRPERVVYGYSPGGSASYHSSVDTIFMGSDVALGDDRSEMAIYEHENVHYEQFHRMLGETEEGFHELVNEAEEEALSQALTVFDDRQLVDAVTCDQHLNYKNFRAMMGLVSGHGQFLDEASYREDATSGRAELLEEDESIEDSPEEIHYNSLAAGIEDIADRYWSEIRESEEVQKFRPLIARYGIEIPDDDILEAQAQFWSIFRIGMLEELPEASNVYPEKLEEKIEGLDWYSHSRSYSNGENVENATREIIEEFRDRKHDEPRPDHEIAVEMLNKGLKRWDREPERTV